MKQLFCTLLAALISLAAWGQKEQDFASRFIALYAPGTSLQCTTVSPLMMERLLKLPKVEGDSTTKQVFSQLKSIRLAVSPNPAETETLYANALQLAKQNPKRYKLYAEEEGKKLYTRSRGRVIVEIVLFMKHEQQFSLINLTGNMNRQILEQLSGI